MRATLSNHNLITRTENTFLTAELHLQLRDVHVWDSYDSCT